MKLVRQAPTRLGGLPASPEIRAQGLHRVEALQIPPPALRDVLLRRANKVIECHKVARTPRSIVLTSSLARINLLHHNMRAPVRSAFNLSPLHRLVVIPAFVADFHAGAHDNDFPFGRAVVAPHPDFSEFFLEHDRSSNDHFEHVSVTISYRLNWNENWARSRVVIDHLVSNHGPN